MHLPRLTFAHPPGVCARYDQLLACSRCATCAPVCPSYAATLQETHSPRGRVQLLRALEENRLPVTPGVRDALATCLDCQACASVCPNGLSPGELVTEMRATHLTDRSSARWLTRLLLGPMLTHPRWLEGGVGLTRLAYQRTGLQSLLRASGLLDAFPTLKRLERALPPLPARSVRARMPALVPAIGPQRGRIGFFLGCAMNTLFADVTCHSIRALTRLGYEVLIPRGVVCCGAPQISLGERDLAQQMARHNLAQFDAVDFIVTDCAACGAELKRYPHLLEDPAADAFAARVRDFAEFVEPRLPADARLEIGSVTYHAPCHLAHAQGVCHQPRALLRHLCADFRDLPEHDRCCGSAGVYWAQHPEIADHTLARKVKAIRHTGADNVVTANPGCLLQLAAGRDAQDTWAVWHISELIDAALGEGAGPSAP